MDINLCLTVYRQLLGHHSKAFLAFLITQAFKGLPVRSLRLLLTKPQLWVGYHHYWDELSSLKHKKVFIL